MPVAIECEMCERRAGWARKRGETPEPTPNAYGRKPCCRVAACEDCYYSRRCHNCGD